MLTPERMKPQDQSKNDSQLWICLMVKVKSDAVKKIYCIETWNIRSIDQGKLDVVKQEMARVNNILSISELKWIGMGKFNYEDHCIYYYGQESRRRNGVALIINKSLKCSI